jgi:hypothetical protein
VLAAVVLAIVISIPVAMAALQQNQTIHVNKRFTQPIPNSSPTTNPTASPSSDTPVVKFSLWFPNGSAYVMNQDNAPSVFGAQNLDTNGIPVNVQSSLGAPPTGYTGGAIVVRNDGNVPITVGAALTNVNTPSDITLSVDSHPINKAIYGTQLNSWMGANNLATGTTIGVGQYAWLSVGVIMTSNVQGSSGVVGNHASFTYSFDAVVTATQA